MPGSLTGAALATAVISAAATSSATAVPIAAATPSAALAITRSGPLIRPRASGGQSVSISIRSNSRSVAVCISLCFRRRERVTQLWLRAAGLAVRAAVLPNLPAERADRVRQRRSDGLEIFADRLWVAGQIDDQFPVPHACDGPRQHARGRDLQTRRAHRLGDAGH